MSNQKLFNVAVVGATGAVGEQIIRLLAERNFPIGELKLLSSARSAGKKINFKGQEITIEEAKPESFRNVDIALFSAGGDVSRALVPEAIKHGTICVDNTSAFRMDPDTPLVVPEVNIDKINENKGVIANPNCSTIQMVQALKRCTIVTGFRALSFPHIRLYRVQGQARSGKRCANPVPYSTASRWNRKFCRSDRFRSSIKLRLTPFRKSINS